MNFSKPLYEIRPKMENKKTRPTGQLYYCLEFLVWLWLCVCMCVCQSACLSDRRPACLVCQSVSLVWPCLGSSLQTKHNSQKRSNNQSKLCLTSWRCGGPSGGGYWYPSPPHHLRRVSDFYSNLRGTLVNSSLATWDYCRHRCWHKLCLHCSYSKLCLEMRATAHITSVA